MFYTKNQEHVSVLLSKTLKRPRIQTREFQQPNQIINQKLKQEDHGDIAGSRRRRTSSRRRSSSRSEAKQDQNTLFIGAGVRYKSHT
jgi:NADH:ubiquinone oxidoreductase subunit D